MAEYIDRVEYCKNYCRCSNEYCDRQSCPIWKAPAADVEPVRHGRWIWHEESFDYECSDCHCRFDYNKTYELFDHGFQFANYCPNCGAKMDLEGENEQP